MDDAVRLLSQRDIAMLMSPADYLAAVEMGFRAANEGRASSPAPLHLAAPGGGFHAKAALIENGRGAYAVLKLNGNFPANAGRPTVQGLIMVSDARTGAPLTIMDSIEVTLRRTAAASALAARYLARRESASVTFCGCGAQAWAHVEAFGDLFSLREGAAWDVDPGKAAAFAFRARQAFGIDMRAAETLKEATSDADIVITSTTSSTAFLAHGDVQPGAFIAAVGADAPHKNEIAPELMAHANVYVDVLAQCLVMGDLHHAIAAGAMTRENVRGDLAALVSGHCPRREHAGEITLFDSTGAAIEDAASAALIFERALDRGVGNEVKFAGL
ncbi:MAG: ornithine cyclodeaminase family protein [Hyphomonadaceae bacterium]